jgi:hypothetical protein
MTRAPDGLPGDPLNVALIGSEADIQRAFAAAGWHPADPITLRSSLAIAGSVVLDRPDPEAPMSTLLLFGRHQDLSFEKDIGRSARGRNHVERDTLMRDLEAAGRITTLYDVTGIGPTLMGRNGGGDRYFTDGELAVGVLAPEGEIGKRPPERLPNPTPTWLGVRREEAAGPANRGQIGDASTGRGCPRPARRWHEKARLLRPERGTTLR